MSDRTYVLAILGTALLLFMILRQVRHGHLRAKYALLWLAVAAVFVPIALIPNALDTAATLLGISYPPALLLVIGLGFLGLLCLHFSRELSRSEERARLIAEETALLRERLERLERP